MKFGSISQIESALRNVLAGSRHHHATGPFLPEPGRIESLKMPVFTRKDIPKLVKDMVNGDIYPIYLIHGERFLCRDTSDALLNALLPAPADRSQQLYEIDGDQEDFNRTLNQLRTYSLFGGRQVLRVTDSRLFSTKGSTKNLWDKLCKAYQTKETDKATRYLGQLFEVSALAPGDIRPGEIAALPPNRWKNLFGFARPQEDLTWVQDILEKLQSSDEHSPQSREKGHAAEGFIKAFTRGIPAGNILILLTESADKRSKFYKFVREHGVIVDLVVDTGGSKAARTAQETIIRDLVEKTLATFGKNIGAKELRMLLDRIGFHPVAAVKETEKLVFYTDGAKDIRGDDINAIIGYTREEALYELTECITGQRLPDALRILTRLLENGIHALAILATLRNHLKKMLLISSLQGLEQPRYTPDFSFQIFQNQYLPALRKGREDWTTLWAGHPYGLFLLFKQTVRFTSNGLQMGLRELLKAEYRLKGSQLPPRLVLEDLLFNLIFTKSLEMERHEQA
jgi:DNA polymerase-3 subunit delta